MKENFKNAFGFAMGLYAAGVLMNVIGKMLGDKVDSDDKSVFEKDGK